MKKDFEFVDSGIEVNMQGVINRVLKTETLTAIEMAVVKGLVDSMYDAFMQNTEFDEEIKKLADFLVFKSKEHYKIDITEVVN